MVLFVPFSLYLFPLGTTYPAFAWISQSNKQVVHMAADVKPVLSALKTGSPWSCGYVLFKIGSLGCYFSVGVVDWMGQVEVEKKEEHTHSATCACAIAGTGRTRLT